MRWVITGADRQSGKDLTYEVEATTSEEAEAQAGYRFPDLLVSAIRPVAPGPTLGYRGKWPQAASVLQVPTGEITLAPRAPEKRPRKIWRMLRILGGAGLTLVGVFVGTAILFHGCYSVYRGAKEVEVVKGGFLVLAGAAILTITVLVHILVALHRLIKQAR